MSRIKLLLFALPALALWLADLSLTASSFSDKAEDAGRRVRSAGADAVSVRLAGRRAELQGLALRLGSSPGAFVTADALRAGKSELASDRLNNVRRNAADAVSTGLRPGLVLGIRTDNGAVFVNGADEAPVARCSGLEVDTVAGAGSDGQTRDASSGTRIVFFSFPLLGSDKEARAVGMLVVGGPLLPEGTADQVALETGFCRARARPGREADRQRRPGEGPPRRGPPGDAGRQDRRRRPRPGRLPRPAAPAALRQRAGPRAPGRAPPRRSRAAAGGAGARQHRPRDVRARRHPALQLRRDGLSRRRRSPRSGCGWDRTRRGCARTPRRTPSPARAAAGACSASPPRQPPVFRAPDASTRHPERVTPAPARSRTAIELDEPPARAAAPPPPPPEAVARGRSPPASSTLSRPTGCPAPHAP